MIHARLLVEILRNRGFKEIVTGQAGLWAFGCVGSAQTFVFEEWQARVSLMFLVEQAERQGATEIVQELKQIERRAADLNS